MKNILPAFLICCLGFYSCKKIAPGLKTTVHGQFYDDYNREAYANIVVKIGEYKSYHTSFIGTADALSKYIDSTVTDANGNYKIDFTTTGNGNAYYLDFFPKKDLSIGDKNGKFSSTNYRSKEIESIGGENEYNFNISKLYYMQAHIIVHNNPFPPLHIGTTNFNMTRAAGSPYIYRTNNDTVLNIPIVKDPSGFYLDFDITNPATGVIYKNPKILINTAINKDTIQGGPYILDPSTFK